MGVRVGNFKLVYVSVTMEAIDPQYLGFTQEMIEAYLKEHPMPEDPAYPKEDMIFDLTESGGFYCLPMETKDETADFIAGLVQALLEGSFIPVPGNN